MYIDDDFYRSDLYDCSKCDDKDYLLNRSKTLLKSIVHQVFSNDALDFHTFEEDLEELSSCLNVRFPNKELQITRK